MFEGVKKIGVTQIAAPDFPKRSPEDAFGEEADPATLKRLARAVRKLPRLQREIFLAARLDDMDYVEIAERTGLSVREVERHIAKALVSIVRRMDRQPGRWWRR
ncbi:sigma factor-like helix-turn-helix DNA-binding protein [Sphingomonas sp. AOB5]|uniref:sigma factor-like helix-turn-helix DNA-binding protein n=1 Tax=Sphingomonas sp. AOB5 TaxID=3034017 RepID=UPI0023F70116|nr:sigma factor-like helix-turn-helix DNA-binding protein [Sphingomonas sp. AOB5]MDF7775693.1 sigma factor-like helix-turn-helix DNA-binding protein [Sphingomonas sp. AOB5]